MPNTAVITTFTLSDTSAAYASATTDSTTTVIDTDPAVPPTVGAAVTASAQTESGTLNVNLLQNASDADPNDALHISNFVWTGHSAGVMPAGFTLDGNAIAVNTDNAAYDDLAPGQTYTAQFSYDVVDQNGSEVAQTATVTIDPLFQAATSHATGSYPAGIAIGDLTGNGIDDLVATNSNFVTGGANPNTVSVLIGNGDGTFQTPTTYATGTNPIAVATADLTGDGEQDLVVANYGSDTVSVLLNNGDGTFHAQETYAAGSQPYAVAVGDFNGEQDVAVANADPTPSRCCSITAMEPSKARPPTLWVRSQDPLRSETLTAS